MFPIKKYDITILLYGNLEFDSRVKRVCKSLSEHYSVSLVSLCDNKNNYNFSTENINHTTINLFSSFLPKNGKYGYIKLLEATIRFFFLSLFSKKVYCNDFETLICGFLLSFFQKKIIYDTHELTPFRGNPTKKKSKLISFFEGLLIKRACVVFTVTERISKWYKLRYKICNVYTLLNSPDIRLPLLEKNNNNRFVWVGIFGDNRGIQSILKNYKLLEKHNIVIDFYGWGPLLEQVQDISSISNSINYCGVLQQNILFGTLSKYKAGLFTYDFVSKNYQYAYPNKFYEYIFSGIPIISTPLLQAKSLISKFNIGVCTIDFTFDSLLTSMINIDNEICMDMFLKNRAIYFEEVKWSKQNDLLLECILNV